MNPGGNVRVFLFVDFLGISSRKGAKPAKKCIIDPLRALRLGVRRRICEKGLSYGRILWNPSFKKAWHKTRARDAGFE